MISPQGINIGMMDPAYFVGRTEIVNWLSEFLQMQIKKIEETASGAIACQLMDAIFPGSIVMIKVDFSAKSEYDYIKNYKLLQSSFEKINIKKVIEVEKLVKGKYQDNFEFMQWMKSLFDSNYPHDQPYDAIGRRAKCKGGTLINRKDAPPYSPKRIVKPKPPTPKPLPPPPVIENTGPQEPIDVTQTEEYKQLQAKLTELLEERENLENVIQNVESERDFYYNKLREIEVLLQENGVNEGDDSVEGAALRILYATDDGSGGLEEENTDQKKTN